MIKYSIVMPYINRYTQLKATLESFDRLYSHRNDFEVIIVEDVKNRVHDTNHRDLYAAVRQFRQIKNINIVVAGNINQFNPSALYNHGVVMASGEYIVLTSPECLHENDVLGAFDADPGLINYVVAACRAHEGAKRAWFQHSEHRPQNYHYCSCIKRRDYVYLGGFDEAYSDGIAYDDNDFRDKIANSHMVTVPIDNAIVRHQKHDKDSPADYTERVARNKALYEAKSLERGMVVNSDC
jgi:glycosyltransferase involved in cell wall biosynthesis